MSKPVSKASALIQTKNRIFTDLICYGASLVAFAAIFVCAITDSMSGLIAIGTLYAIFAAAAVGFANQKDKFLYATIGAIVVMVIVAALLHANIQSPLVWLAAKFAMVLVAAVFGVAIAKKFTRAKVWVALGMMLLAFVVHFGLEEGKDAKKTTEAQETSDVYSRRDLAEDALFTLAAAVFCEIFL
jgi:hypothetical protein